MGRRHPLPGAWRGAGCGLPTTNARVAAHGGTYITRTANHEQVEGDNQPAVLRIIIAWPSHGAALTFMQDNAYAPHLKARTDG